jgi:DNA invertase Pin-like site-specific DNA recombinase
MTQTKPKPSFIRAYLRASTDEQDANRAKQSLEHFTQERGLVICNFYVENASGAKLERPQLFRLLDDSRAGDILLVEDIDRLSRLTAIDWDTLKRHILKRNIRVVAVNVPTTWQHLFPAIQEFDARIFVAINGMLLDMLAAIARRDYDQRRERQQQGIAKAKAAGKYTGRKINQERYDAINRLVASGTSWSAIQRIVGCSRGTIASAIRHAAVNVKPAEQTTTAAIPATEADTTCVSVLVWFGLENGSKFTRGKKQSRENIITFLEIEYEGRRRSENEVLIQIAYSDSSELKSEMENIISELHSIADGRNCMITDYSLQNHTTGRFWDEYDEHWRE